MATRTWVDYMPQPRLRLIDLVPKHPKEEFTDRSSWYLLFPHVLGGSHRAPEDPPARCWLGCGPPSSDPLRRGEWHPDQGRSILPGQVLRHPLGGQRPRRGLVTPAAAPPPLCPFPSPAPSRMRRLRVAWLTSAPATCR